MLSMKLAAAIGVLVAAPAVAAAQDPVATLPDAYKLQFENDWVRVVRVHIDAGAHLPTHSHPAALIAYVYLNDADPIVFKHDGGPGTITRPAVKARSYRLSTGMGERHAIENNSSTATDYLRIEYKTEGSQQSRTRRRTPAPPLKTENSVDVEFTNKVMRITRITVGAKETLPYDKRAGEPAVMVDLTVFDSGKPSRVAWWIPPEVKDERLVNDSDQPREYLRFDFLTKPSS